MIRDLTDVRAEAVVQRHATYWQNGEWHRPFGCAQNYEEYKCASIRRNL